MELCILLLGCWNHYFNIRNAVGIIFPRRTIEQVIEWFEVKRVLRSLSYRKIGSANSALSEGTDQRTQPPVPSKDGTGPAFLRYIGGAFTLMKIQSLSPTHNEHGCIHWKDRHRKLCKECCVIENYWKSFGLLIQWKYPGSPERESRFGSEGHQ